MSEDPDRQDSPPDATPPPAELPPPPESREPVLNLAAAWAALSQPGRWFVVIAWVAVFAAAVAGFTLAASGDDDPRAVVVDTGAFAPPAPVSTGTSPETTGAVPPGGTVTDVVTDVETRVETATESTTVTDATTVTTVTTGEAVGPREFSGDGDADLGTVEVAEDAILFWTNDTGEIRVTWGAPPRNLVQSGEREGEIDLPAASYPDFRVESDGLWTLEILPG